MMDVMTHILSLVLRAEAGIGQAKIEQARALQRACGSVKNTDAKHLWSAQARLRFSALVPAPTHGRRKQWMRFFLCLAFLLFITADVAWSSSWRAIGPGADGAVECLAIHPNNPNIMLAGSDVGTFYRTEDGGKTWVTANKGIFSGAKSSIPIRGFFPTQIVFNPKDPNRVYAVTRCGLLRSVDSGKSWLKKSVGLLVEENPTSAFELVSLQLDPTDPGRLYVMDQSGYLYKSTDHGEHFRTMGQLTISDVEDPDILDKYLKKPLFARGKIPTNVRLAIDPTSPANNRTLYAATIYDGVYRSTDGGHTWQQAGLANKEMNTVACYVDPKTGDSVVIAFVSGRKTLTRANRGSHNYSAGLFVSHDGGKTWKRRAEDVFSGAWNIANLIIHPASQNMMLIAEPMRSTSPKKGVWLSEDYGYTWQPLLGNSKESCNYELGWYGDRKYIGWFPQVRAQGLAISRSDPRVIVVHDGPIGTLKTVNLGKNWENLSSKRVAKANYYRSSGFNLAWGWGIAVDPTDSNTLYIGFSDRGPFMSRDQGHTLKGLFRESIELGGLSLLNGKTLIPGSEKMARGQLQKAVAEKIGRADLETLHIVVDPDDPRRVYFATGEQNHSAGVILVTLDGGDTFKIMGCKVNGLSGTSVNCLALDETSPLSARTLYAGTYATGVYKTTDGGITWAPANGGMEKQSCRELAISKQNPQTLYAACGLGSLLGKANKALPSKYGGIFKTGNGGQTWAKTHTAFADVTRVAVDPKNETVVYAAVTHRQKTEKGTFLPGGIYKSVDSGGTWECIFPNLYPVGLRVHPRNSSLVYAAFRQVPTDVSSFAAGADFVGMGDRLKAGVFVSEDAGRTWNEMTGDLKDQTLRFTSLELDPNDQKTVYVGSNLGLFRYEK